MRIEEALKPVYLFLRMVIFNFFRLFIFLMMSKKIEKSKIDNILVVALFRVGDAVNSVPTLRVIRNNFPRARIIVLTNEYIKDIFEGRDYADNVFFVEKRGFLKDLRTYHFDLAVDLTCDYEFKYAFLAYLSGAKYTIGYDIWGRGFLFNLPLKFPKGLHISQEMLNIVKAIGLTATDQDNRIPVSKEDREWLRDFLRRQEIGESHVLIGIAPGAFERTKRWPAEKFSQLANAILKKYKARIILIGPKEEISLLNKIVSGIKGNALIFSGYPLKYVFALIQRCDLLVCNNSGPLHIASAVGCPTVSTMGPTIPKRWWPLGERHIVIKKDLHCMPCSSAYCYLKTTDCMNRIEVNEMLEAVETQLSDILKVK